MTHITRIGQIDRAIRNASAEAENAIALLGEELEINKGKPFPENKAGWFQLANDIDRLTTLLTSLREQLGKCRM